MYLGAEDYVQAMWLMLQNNEAKDYVCATGESRSVQELVDYVFNKLNLSKEIYVESSEKYQRPEELNYLRGDSTKIREELNWNPSYNFNSMIDEMIEYWLNKN